MASAPERDGLAGLRQRIAEIEGRGIPADRPVAETVAEESDTRTLAPRRGGNVLPFGVPGLDAMLRGGLRRNALHELRGEASRNGAATGFALALAARLARRDDRPVLWIAEGSAAREAGNLYAPGLAAFGLAPERLILVRVGKPAEALWVFEEGLRCRGLAFVAAEIRGYPAVLDLTASRRLALRARDSGVMGLLVRQTDRSEPGAAQTRWQVTPRPAAITDGYAAGIGRPAWRLRLERNRRGATGTIDLEWDHARRSFTDAAVPRAVAAASPDRPGPPAAVGQVVAFRSAS